jgi:hypothetical protein
MYICILMQKMSLSEIDLIYVRFSSDATEVGMNVSMRTLLCSVLLSIFHSLVVIR